MQPINQYDLYLNLTHGFAALPPNKHLVAQWDIANKKILLYFSTAIAAQKMGQAISGLRFLDKTQTAQAEHIDYDLIIHCWDGEGDDHNAPLAPSWDMHGIDSKGTITLPASDNILCSYVWGVGALQAYSIDSKHAYYWVPDALDIPYWEASFPFRQILTWFFAKHNIQPMHAAAVSKDGKGFLLPGKSGSGKSTTSLNLSLAGFEYLGDDYILLDLESKPTTPLIWSLYHSAKVDDYSLSLLPSLDTFAHKVNHDDPKSVLCLKTISHQNKSHNKIDYVLLPRVIANNTQTTLTPARASDVILALAPTTIHHLNVSPNKVLGMAKNLAAQCPAYWLNLGSDVHTIPELINETFYQAHFS